MRNDDISFLSRAEKAKLWQEDQNKSPGDITLYRIYWKHNKKDDWRPFPGLFDLSYPGKSDKTAKERAYGSNGHIYQAFRQPRIMIEKTIRNYARRLGIDTSIQENYKDPRLRAIFKVEVLKIIKFQGNRAQIAAIEDVDKRRAALHDAEEKTIELANYYERFFVGFYHSQFPEFGRNKAQGGDFSTLKSFIPIDHTVLNDAFEKVKYLSYQNAPYQVLSDLIFPGVAFKSKESTLLHNIEFYTVNEVEPFKTEWRKRQDAYIKERFEEGYNTGDIARKMNEIAQRELGVYFRVEISEWGINLRIKEIYSDWHFSDKLSPTEIRKIILKEKLEALYNDGHTSYNALLPHFPVFATVRQFRDYVSRNYAGLRGLFRDSLDLISTDSFRRTVELIRYYEENNIEYTHTSLWNDLFSTSHPAFYKRFGLELIEIKIFALTGILPHRFGDIDFQL
ncbi:MAG: hypothetical protein ACFFG0_29690 [Candidatus Thorarchaeota archaeon]